MTAMPKDSLTTALEAALDGLDYPAPRAKLLTFAYMNYACREVARPFTHT